MFVYLFHEGTVVPNSYDSESVILQLGADLGILVSLLRSVVIRPIHENANTGLVFPVVVEVWLDMHFGSRAVLGIVGQPYTVVTEESEELLF